MRTRRRKPALTLLETLLALVLTGVILGTLHTALWSGVRAYRRCRETSRRDTMAWSAVRLVGDDLLRLAAQAPPTSSAGLARPEPAGASPPAVLLGLAEVGRGGGCLLRMRTCARPAAGARDMLVDYFFVPSPREKVGSLARRSEPLGEGGSSPAAPPAGWEDPNVRYEVVASGLRSVRFRYFDGRRWEDNWDSAVRGEVPRLVEMVVELPDGAGGGVRYVQALPLVVEKPLLGASPEAQTP